MPTLSTIKRCTKCGLELPVSLFSKNRRSKDGLYHWCKECVKAHNAEYCEANREERNTKKRARHAANRERDNAKLKAYARTPKGFTAKLWHDLNQRTINGKYPRLKSKQCRRYLDKHIRLEITREELYQFVLIHWDFIQAVWDSGELVDLHRPDNSRHYSLDNIEFLAHSVHLKLHGLKNKKAS